MENTEQYGANSFLFSTAKSTFSHSCILFNIGSSAAPQDSPVPEDAGIEPKTVDKSEMLTTKASHPQKGQTTSSQIA
jgi:hypothetical protein